MFASECANNSDANILGMLQNLATPKGQSIPFNIPQAPGRAPSVSRINSCQEIPQDLLAEVETLNSSKAGSER